MEKPDDHPHNLVIFFRSSLQAASFASCRPDCLSISSFLPASTTANYKIQNTKWTTTDASKNLVTTTRLNHRLQLQTLLLRPVEHLTTTTSRAMCSEETALADATAPRRRRRLRCRHHPHLLEMPLFPFLLYASESFTSINLRKCEEETQSTLFDVL
jgi:hypothetical protein